MMSKSPSLIMAWVLSLGVLLSSCHIVRGLIKLPPADDDYQNKVTVKKVAKSTTPYFFAKNLDPTIAETRFLDGDGVETTLASYLEASQTQGFLFIQDDTIRYEQYFDNYDRSTPVMVWSISKAFSSTLLGMAIEDGHIQSKDDLILQYIPELRGQIDDSTRIRHLIDMTSGINYSNRRFKVSPYAMAHYSKDLSKVAMQSRSVIPPEEHFYYSQTDVIILGLILRRAIGRPIPEYLEEKLWQPLGMEYDAFWAVDETDLALARTASGLFICPEDLAKFGRLYLNGGQFRGQQVLNPAWVQETLYDTHPKQHRVNLWRRTFDMTKPFDDKEDYAPDSLIIGLKGEVYSSGATQNKLLFLVPEQNIIIVRFGKGVKDKLVRESMSSFAEAHAYLQENPQVHVGN
jgi:CubicO group peptidase (beta-lactamase class C family)